MAGKAAFGDSAVTASHGCGAGSIHIVVAGSWLTHNIYQNTTVAEAVFPATVGAAGGIDISGIAVDMIAGGRKGVLLEG